MPVWNGEAFLRQTLDSLLGQDYKNIELIILDNLSTDGTGTICKEYARRDSRIRYVLDTEHVSAIEGHRRVARMARGDLFMGACDDDVYDTSYISALVTLLRRNPEVGLAYAALGYISPAGVKTIAEPGRLPFRTSRHSRASNFTKYLLWRMPMPMGFGVIRTKLHLDALRYFERVDHHSRWDHDNLWMLRLLTLARVDSNPNVRFYYRQQDRVALYAKRNQLIVPAQSGGRYLEDVSHEIKVTRRILQMLNEASFGHVVKMLLRTYCILMLSFNCGGRELARKTLAILKGRKVEESA